MTNSDRILLAIDRLLSTASATSVQYKKLLTGFADDLTAGVSFGTTKEDRLFVAAFIDFVEVLNNLP